MCLGFDDTRCHIIGIYTGKYHVPRKCCPSLFPRLYDSVTRSLSTCHPPKCIALTKRSNLPKKQILPSRGNLLRLGAINSTYTNNECLLFIPFYLKHIYSQNAVICFARSYHISMYYIFSTKGSNEPLHLRDDLEVDHLNCGWNPGTFFLFDLIYWHQSISRKCKVEGGNLVSALTFFFSIARLQIAGHIKEQHVKCHEKTWPKWNT
jgi:hypothetical protein